ncbi:MAG: Bacterial pre-peptidase C-terminal domain [Chthonomonadales bacterium]|nr:Bacterial pre-peptidase C-terminal domain [Chthonomonadales bacterium]
MTSVLSFSKRLPLLCLLLTTGLLMLSPFTSFAGAQRHPMEISTIYPLGGSAGMTTRVTITGLSLRNAGALVFNTPGLTAKIVSPDPTSLPAQTPDSDGNPPVLVDITAPKEAVPGIYSFRIVSPSGVSDARKWIVGWNTPQTEAPKVANAPIQSVELPTAVNGHILEAGDRATFGFDLSAGETFVALVVAAAADSPLDSLLTLRDATGREVAGNDDEIGSDSLLRFVPPKSGHYTLTLSSSVGAGGANYSYRLSMGRLPILRALFPSSIVLNKPTTVKLIGSNLPATADAPGQPLPGVGAPTLNATMSLPGIPTPLTSNALPLYYSGLPTVLEAEPNDTPAQATAVPVPGVICGQFLRTDNSPDSDTDFYRFHANAGQRLLIDVQCQAVGSQADATAVLTDTNGKTLMANDDTYGRDPHLDFTAPQAGDYLLRVRESTGRSAPEMVYRLLILPPPAPNFTLSVETRGRVIGQGDSLILEVNVARNGFDGPVTLTVPSLPPGVGAMPSVIPAGSTRGLLVLSALPTAPVNAFPLQIVGAAEINGKTVTQPLAAVSDWIWQGGMRRTVPAPPELRMLAVGPPAELTLTTTAKQLTLAQKGSVKIPIHLDRHSVTNKPITLRVLGLPDGVTVADVVVKPEQNDVELELKAIPTARLGAFQIVPLALANHNPNVQLERFSAPITLTVTK